MLIQNGIVYATAGKSSDGDGSVAVCAFDLTTGKQRWAANVGNLLCFGK